MSERSPPASLAPRPPGPERGDERDERGRLKRGHRMGRPPGKSVHPLASAFQRLGTSTDDVRTEVVSRMLALAREGDFGALRFLGERLVPRGRALENIFEGVPPDPEARLAALVDHVGRGTLSPEEAQEVADVVRAHADAQLWGNPTTITASSLPERAWQSTW